MGSRVTAKHWFSAVVASEAGGVHRVVVAPNPPQLVAAERGPRSAYFLWLAGRFGFASSFPLEAEVLLAGGQLGAGSSLLFDKMSQGL